MGDEPPIADKKYASFPGLLIGAAGSLLVAIVSVVGLWLAVASSQDPSQTEGLATYSGWVVSVLFSLGAIIGGAVCLGTSRLVAPGSRRRAATWISAIVFGLPVLVLITDVALVVVLVAGAWLS